jgi:hypothetical protein
VPSSTFSSDRIDDGFRLSHIVAGIATGLLLLLAVESLWRVHGVTTNYVDNKPRWSNVRAAVDEQSGVVLLGDSRMQFGFSLDAFRDRYPDTPVHQLAIVGESPFATLRDLAATESFKGVVLVSFTPEIVMQFHRNDQQSHVDHFRKRWTTDVRLNFLAGSLAESVLVSRQYKYGVDSILREIIGKRQLPPANRHLVTKSDREILVDYSMENQESHQMRRVAAADALYEEYYPVDPARWQAEFDDFAALAETINARGGCVVAIRFPSQGELYEREQALYPNPDFWARVAASPYIQSLHFDRLRSMDSIVMPDFMHVDNVDKYRFTEDLLATLENVSATSGGDRCSMARQGRQPGR